MQRSDDPGASSVSRGAVVVLVLLFTVVVLAGTVVLLGLRARADARAQGQDEAVLAAARQTTLKALAVGLLGATVLLGVSVIGAARTTSAGVAGLAAAVELTPALLTYDYRTLATDTARAQSGTTGEFADQYRTLAELTLGPNAGQQQFVSKAEVRDSSVVTAAPDQVVALLYLSQVSTSKNLTVPRLDSSGVRVTMSEVDGRWLISRLDRI